MKVRDSSTSPTQVLICLALRVIPRLAFSILCSFVTTTIIGQLDSKVEHVGTLHLIPACSRLLLLPVVRCAQFFSSLFARNL